MIIDFEGESTRPMSERRRKRSALRDVAAIRNRSIMRPCSDCARC